MTNLATIPRERSAFPYSQKVTIRYSDQDPMQHVNNVAITAYLEAGRAALIHDLIGGTSHPLNGMVLAHVSIDYLNEITYPGEVEVVGRLTAAGSKSITSDYAIFKDDRCCVVSRSVNVFFDTATRKAREPAPDLAEKIRAILDQSTSAP